MNYKALDLMTKRRRYLLGELKRIEVKESNLNIKNRISTD